MEKSIIELAYNSQVEDDGELYPNVESEAYEEYGKLLDVINNEVGKDKVDVKRVRRLLLDLEMAVGSLSRNYEKRGYTMGFKDGIKLNNEIKALN